MQATTYKPDIKTIRYYKALKKLTHFLNRHIFLLVAAIACIGLFYTSLNQWNGRYNDADGYMRALKIYHWLLNPSFSEQLIYESNYPFGEILHWTRPMDIIWLVISIPFWFLNLPIKETLFIAGAHISPILGVIACLALTYGLRRRFNIYLTLFGAILFLCDQMTIITFSPGRPDHHSFMILLAVYSLSLVLCWLKKRQDRYLRILGIILALAVFTVIEGIILYIAFISFFTWLYIFKNISLTPAVKISKYFTLSLTLFWLLNPPYEGMFYPLTGRISIFYVTAGALSYLGLILVQHSHLHSPRLKILSILCVALGFLLSLFVIFDPDELILPYNPEIHTVFIAYISEIRHIYQLQFFNGLSLYLFPLTALLLNIFMLKKKAYNRIMMLNLCLAVPYFCLTMFAMRFEAYNLVYCILPFLSFIDYLYKKSAFYKNKNADFPAIIWTIMFILVTVQMLIPALPEFSANKQAKRWRPSSQLCRQIEKIGGTILTDVFLSPEIVWRCNVNTVGTPYHQNTTGILDTYNIFGAEDDHRIIPLLLKHQITQILIPEKYGKARYSLKSENSKKLYYKLIKQENIPPYLSKVPSFQKESLLYEVKI